MSEEFVLKTEDLTKHYGGVFERLKVQTFN